MSSHQYLTNAGQFSSYLAGASFGIGTFFLILHKAFQRVNEIILLGWYYVFIAFAINLLVFLFLFYLFIMNRSYRGYFSGKMFLMLTNIPIAGFYLLLVINNSTI